MPPQHHFCAAPPNKISITTSNDLLMEKSESVIILHYSLNYTINFVLQSVKLVSTTHTVFSFFEYMQLILCYYLNYIAN